MYTTNQKDHLEAQIEQNKLDIARSEALSRLQNNEDFKLLFLENYLKDYASTLVHLKAAPEKSDDESQKMIASAITGIGEFKQYLMSIFQLGAIASKSLKGNEETLDELNNEE